MIKLLKVVVGIIVILGLVWIIGVPKLNNSIANRLETVIDSTNSENAHISFDNISVDVLKQEVLFTNLYIANKDGATDRSIGELRATKLEVQNLDFWKYYKTKQVDIDDVTISGAVIKYHEHTKLNKSTPRQDSLSDKKSNFNNNIAINNIELKESELYILKAETDSVRFYSKNFNLKVGQIVVNENTVKEKVPFTYSSYQLIANDIFYELNQFENLEIISAEVSDANATIKDLKLQTKFSREDLSKELKKERDHYNVQIDSMTITDFDYGYQQDTTFYLTVPKIALFKPVLDVYRDKTLADNYEKKPLYSKKLRELNINLDLKEIVISNGNITYEEHVNRGKGAGVLLFQEMNATAKNISKTYADNEKTTVDIACTFMNKTPMDVHIEFDVNDETDHFIYKTEMGHLAASELNAFTEPNLQVRFTGDLNKTYITVDGNDNRSNVNVRMNYDAFKVIVLKEGGREKNKLLSAIANIFIRKNSETRKTDYVLGSNNNVIRDKTKSIFNFFWLSIRAGLIDAITGNDAKK